MKRELLIWKIDDKPTADVEDFLVLTRPKFNWFWFKWLQLREYLGYVGRRTRQFIRR